MGNACPVVDREISEVLVKSSLEDSLSNRHTSTNLSRWDKTANWSAAQSNRELCLLTDAFIVFVLQIDRRLDYVLPYHDDVLRVRLD